MFSFFSKNHFEQGKAALKANDWNKAIAEFSSELKKNPQNTDVFAYRAKAYLSKQDLQAALNDFNKVLELDTGNKDTLLSRALILANLKRFDEALADCENVLSRFPQLVDAYTKMGQVYKIKQDYPKSIESCSKALEINPNHAEAYYLRGMSYHMLEEDAKAIADLEKSLEIAGDMGGVRETIMRTRLKLPKEIQAINDKGIAEAQQGNFAAALLAFNEIIEKLPNHSGAYGNRGNVYRFMNRFDEAIRDYDRAMELEPLNGDALFGRAMAFGEMNPPNYYKTVENLTAFLKLRPDMGLAYRIRAVAHAKLQRDAETLQDLQQYSIVDKAGYLQEKDFIDAWMKAIKQNI